MNYETIEVKDTESLVQHLISYEAHWMFRGHSSETWGLDSTLERMLAPLGWSPELAKKCEDFSLFRFRSNAHHYVTSETLPTSKLGWLSLMQHHGVPTRLLDFTVSPFIAAFFAFDGVDPDQNDRCAIWAIDYRSLTKKVFSYIKKQNKKFNFSYSESQMQQDKVFEAVIDKNSYNVLWITEPGIFNLRLERQRGTFLLSGNIGKKTTDLLPNFLSSETIKKIVVPAKLTSEIFKVMDKMGISNSRLFSNIDGLGKDIKNEILHQVTYKGRSQINTKT